MTIRLFTAAALATLAGQVLAQAEPGDASAADTTRGTLTVSAYVDGYYSRFSNDLPAGELQPYTTVGARENHFGLNVAQVGVAYVGPRVRSTVVLHYGDIAEATWSATFRPVQQGYVGVRLAEGLWLDAGFFATHIGSESFLPKNNMLSQTAVLTFNEPFYQAGARLAYAPTDRLTLELWGLNGYNSHVDNNSAKSVGLLASFAANDGLTLAYTSLLGRESPDDAPREQVRYYQSVYADVAAGPVRWLTGFDLGVQTNTVLDDPTATALLLAGHTTARYTISDAYSVTARGEFFRDPDGFISGVLADRRGGAAGLQLVAATLGAEYRPRDGAYLRIEGRHLVADEELEVFNRDGAASRSRTELLLTLGLSLEGVVARF